MTGQPRQYLETQPVAANLEVSWGQTNLQPPPPPKQTSEISRAPCPIKCIRNGIPGPETDSGAPDQRGQAKLTDNIPGIKEGKKVGIPCVPPHC